MVQPYTWTSELKENGRYRYEETNEPMESIAADFGVTVRHFRKLVVRWGWKRRKDRPPRDVPPDLRLLLEAEEAVRAAAAAVPPGEEVEPEPTGAPSEPAADEQAAPAEPSVADRLERQLEEQVAAMETMRAQLGPQAPADAERIARTLGRLAETLFRVRRLRGSPNAPIEGSYDDRDMPKDPDAFREALACRLEALFRSRADTGEPAAGEPAGAGRAR